MPSVEVPGDRGCHRRASLGQVPIDRYLCPLYRGGFFDALIFVNKIETSAVLNTADQRFLPPVSAEQIFEWLAKVSLEQSELGDGQTQTLIPATLAGDFRSDAAMGSFSADRSTINAIMTLELSDDETLALTDLLKRMIDEDCYTLSPRVLTLKAILAKIEPRPNAPAPPLAVAKLGDRPCAALASRKRQRRG